MKEKKDPKKQPSRAMVFVDGSNFYHRLKHLCEVGNPEKEYSLIRFDYKGFLEKLIDNSSLVEARYYVGAVRRVSSGVDKERSERLYSNQQRLIANLQKQSIPCVLGKLIRHPDNSIHEKGVDVRIAVEMIRHARKNTYDKAYLLSSDTDLVDAVTEVQRLGKEVVYVGSPKNISYGLSKISNDEIILRFSDIEPFMPEKPPTLIK